MVSNLFSREELVNLRLKLEKVRWFEILYHILSYEEYFNQILGQSWFTDTLKIPFKDLPLALNYKTDKFSQGVIKEVIIWRLEVGK